MTDRINRSFIERIYYNRTTSGGPITDSRGNVIGSSPPSIFNDFNMTFSNATQITANIITSSILHGIDTAGWPPTQTRINIDLNPVSPAVVDTLTQNLSSFQINAITDSRYNYWYLYVTANALGPNHVWSFEKFIFGTQPSSVEDLVAAVQGKEFTMFGQYPPSAAPLFELTDSSWYHVNNNPSFSSERDAAGVGGVLVFQKETNTLPADVDELRAENDRYLAEFAALLTTLSQSGETGYHFAADTDAGNGLVKLRYITTRNTPSLSDFNSRVTINDWVAWSANTTDTDARPTNERPLNSSNRGRRILSGRVHAIHPNTREIELRFRNGAAVFQSDMPSTGDILYINAPDVRR